MKEYNEDLQPDFTKPVDIKAFLNNEFGICDCAEFDVIVEIMRYFLHSIEQKPIKYDSLFEGNTGIYYILAGMMEKAGLMEHGTSIRNPFLTNPGRQFLHALESISSSIIDESSGLAYDGLFYGF